MLILQIRASSITLFVEKLQPDHQQILLAHFLQIYIYISMYDQNLLQIRAKMQQSWEHLRNCSKIQVLSRKQSVSWVVESTF